MNCRAVRFSLHGLNRLCYSHHLVGAAADVQNSLIPPGLRRLQSQWAPPPPQTQTLTPAVDADPDLHGKATGSQAFFAGQNNVTCNYQSAQQDVSADGNDLAQYRFIFFQVGAICGWLGAKFNNKFWCARKLICPL
jgi:hypothetical protein